MSYSELYDRAQRQPNGRIKTSWVRDQVIDLTHISTSYVERQNLTMRMSMRRFTRLTNGFSKKLDNHIYALALYFVHYNFCRMHKTLRMSPAMAAGVSDTLWTLDKVLERVDANEAEKRPAKRGPYKKRQPSA
jgi:hypothetical protein